MKKTMFITSVIMVVVMAIALTTSSLAWFTSSSNAYVTTETLSIRAKAASSSGIQITNLSDLSAWFGTFSLVNDDVFGASDGNTGMLPVVPYTSATNNTLLDALAGCDFIYNEIDSNNQFVNATGTVAEMDTEHSKYDIFYSENIFITNMAQGAGASAVYIEPTITFYKGTTESAYVWDGSHNTSDPNLYVAVLAENSTEYMAADGTARGNTAADWEIVNIFCSRNSSSAGGVASAVTYGGVASNFAAEASADKGTYGTQIAASTWTVSKTFKINNVNTAKTVTSTPINAIGIQATGASAGEYRPFGAVKQFKVVAWYDGDSLVNSNSGTTLMFKLTFNAWNASALVTGD